MAIVIVFIIMYIPWLLSGKTAMEAYGGIIQLCSDRETTAIAGIPYYEC